MAFNSSNFVRLRICFLILIILLAFSNTSADEIPIPEQEKIARKQIAEWLEDASYGDLFSVEKQEAIKTQLEEIELYFHHKSWLPIVKVIYKTLGNYKPQNEDIELVESNEEQDVARSDSEEPNTLNKIDAGNNVAPSKKCDAKEYRISEVLHHGKIVVLRDGAKFLIDVSDMKESSKWGHSDKIMICKTKIIISGNFFEHYELANLENDFNEFVGASPMD
jgi:hypothetical protein